MNLCEKILTIRKAIKDSGLKKEGNGYSFKFFDMPDIEPLITELCAQYKVLTLVTFPENRAVMQVYDAEKPTDTFSVEVTPRECTMKSVNPIQATGAMMSYMRRYLYLAVFCISESDLVDSYITTTKEQSINMNEQTEKLRKKNLIDKKEPGYSDQMVQYAKVSTFTDLSMDYIDQCMNGIGVKDGRAKSK